MRKAAHPPGGMGSLNPCRWRGERLHHGGDVCLLFVQMCCLVWSSLLVVCRQVPQDNLKMRLKTLLFAPPTRAPHHYARPPVAVHVSVQDRREQLAALGGRNKGLSMQFIFNFINLSSCPQPPPLSSGTPSPRGRASPSPRVPRSTPHKSH
jgi:hypothetical protein